jgi:alpha-amylase
VVRTTEFDPDFDPRGVQASTALGLAGRAPIVFIHDPAIHRLPPRPGILGTAAAYHALGRILNFDDPAQSMTGDFSGGLKDVATENPQVRATMIDVFAHWVELINFDGLRIDTIKHVEHGFWQQFATGVRTRLAPQGKTKFFLFGEALDGNDQLLGSYTQPGELDSVFYFSQHFSVFRDVFEFAHDRNQQKSTRQIANLWAQKTAHYGTVPQQLGIGIPPHKALVNFMDNHDRPRFLFDGAGDVTALRNALTFLMTEEGIPCLYYGTELDFDGGNDPANREVLWPLGFPTDGVTFTHFARLAGLRKRYAALRRGDTTIRYATDATGEEADAGLFAFERSGGDAEGGYALVVLNTNARHRSTTAGAAGPMLVSVPEGTHLVDVLDPMKPTYSVGPAGSLQLNVEEQTAKILVPADQVGAAQP